VRTCFGKVVKLCCLICSLSCVGLEGNRRGKGFAGMKTSLKVGTLGFR